MENKEFDIKDLVGKVTGTGGKLADPFDVSAALLGTVIGFVVVDIPAMHLLIPPGTGAVLGASTAVGVEQAVKGWLGIRQKEREAWEKEREARRQGVTLSGASASSGPAGIEDSGPRRKLRDKADALEKFLAKKDENEFLDILKSNLELWQSYIIDDKQFDDELEKVITKYRERMVKGKMLSQ